VSYSKVAIHVSNIFTSKSIVGAESHRLSLRQLENLHADCIVIYLPIGHVINPVWSGGDQHFVGFLHKP
jgi:hypothetical protein